MFGCDFGIDDFKSGDLVAYFNGGHAHVGGIEIGVVKEVTEHGCRVAYHLGDTTAMTPFECLVPVTNAYAAKGLVERMEQLGVGLFGISPDCEDWGGHGRG